MALNGGCLAGGRTTQLWEAVIEEVRGRRISRSSLDRKHKYRLQGVSVLEEQGPRERFLWAQALPWSPSSSKII